MQILGPEISLFFEHVTRWYYITINNLFFFFFPRFDRKTSDIIQKLKYLSTIQILTFFYISLINLSIHYRKKKILSHLIFWSSKKNKLIKIKKDLSKRLITNHRDLIEFKPKSLTFHATLVTRQRATLDTKLIVIWRKHV